MKRVLAVCAGVVLILGLAGCGGGSSSSSTSPTTSSGSALLLVRQTGVGLLGLSSRPDHLFRLELPLEFSNGSGVGCNLSYGRLQLFSGGEEVERSSVTADDIVAQAGTTLVAQGAPLRATFIFNFNTRVIEQAGLTVSAVDHNGHTIERQINSLDVELAPELLE